MTLHSPERRWEYLPDIFGGVESISDALIIREENIFLLTDQAGNVPAENNRGLGLYHRDTRHLSAYDFMLNGSLPVVLLSTADSGYGQEQVLGNHRAITGEGHVIGRCTVEVIRQRVLGHGGLEEKLRITNYNPFPVTVRPEYRFGADFADIFEVRGHPRAQPGFILEPEVSEGWIRHSYTGLDGVGRTTRIVFDGAPDELSPLHAIFSFDLEPRQSVELRLQILLEETASLGDDLDFHRVASDHTHWRETFAFVRTDNEIFNKVLDRSFTDLRMLWTHDRHGNGYFAAGTPWFDTLFGRDSLITSTQVLAYRPDLARECLFMLSRLQGRRVEPSSCEEPGKILHEMREDELSVIGELPYGQYFGSVDSTPLFLLLAGEYYRWTGDLAAMRTFRANITAALHWVRDFGTPDPDLYLKYPTTSPTGLRNQGWKDSENCIVHQDGSLCSGPIALVEAQGYLYAALRSLIPVFDALDDPDEADRLRHDAEVLKERFRKDFWLQERHLVPMALDGEMRPAEVMSSNAGQVLWSGILDQRRATAVRDALFSNDMFSGWGIRTLSSECPAFNPVGYHLGTIWPHDNAIIAAGLKRHGFDEEVNEVATALFDTACEFPSFRLPEVYGGHPRSAHQPPVPYPVACRPQAWASGAMLHVLQSVLGLAPDASNRKLYIVRPRLPYWLGEVRLRGLRVGDGFVDLTYTRTHGRTRAEVERAEDVVVVHANRWPDL